jgi:ferredoxin-type protein NapG/ferredoxin-type protein NapH
MSLSRRELFQFWRRTESEPGANAPTPAPLSARPALAVLRPPGALPESLFVDTCARCGKCVEVCPRQAIRPLGPEAGRAAGTPFIVPREAPCVLCTGLHCTVVCPSGALRPIARDDIRMGLAVLDAEACHVNLGQACDACHRSCPIPGAITIGRRGPVVDPARCVGCGLCEEACPAEPSAILVYPYQQP